MRPEPLGDDFDQIERLTRRVGRGAAVGLPTWIVLLGLLPLTGWGPLACLSLATVLAVGVVFGAERRRTRRLAADEAGHGDIARRRGERRPMSALPAVALTLAAVIALIYVVFVIRAA